MLELDDDLGFTYLAKCFNIGMSSIADMSDKYRGVSLIRHRCLQESVVGSTLKLPSPESCTPEQLEAALDEADAKRAVQQARFDQALKGYTAHKWGQYVGAVLVVLALLGVIVTGNPFPLVWAWCGLFLASVQFNLRARRLPSAYEPISVAQTRVGGTSG